MGLADYLRNQNYGGMVYNTNRPTNLGGGGVKGYSDEEYNGMSLIEAAAKSIGTIREQTKQRTTQQVISDLLKSQETMFGQAVSRRNSATSKEEMKAAQLDAFAAIVKGRGAEDYPDEWDAYNTTKDIIGHYIDLNNSPEVNNRLVQYAESQENPYDFAMSMGILLTPEQKRIRKMQNDLDTLFGTSTPKWLTKTVDFFGNQIRGGLAGWTEQIEKGDYNGMFANSSSDEAPVLGALENYAYSTFGKHINNLDEYEINKLLIDLQDTELLKKHLPDHATEFANKFEGATYGALTNAFPTATLSLEGISSIPVVGDITSWIFRNIARGLGQTLTYSVLSPIAGPVSYNLNNEEERLDFYEALGALFIWRDHENNGGASTRGKWDKNAQGAFKKFLNSDFKSNLGEKIGDIKEMKEGGETVLGWIKNKVKERNESSKQKNEAKTREKINDKANKALVNPEIWQNEQAADAFMQLDNEAVEKVNKSKNKSSTLLQEFDKISKAYENAENMIADTIEKMYGLNDSYENPISTEAGGKKYTSNMPKYYIRDWIDIMKEIAEYQEEQQYIDLAGQIARDGNLTPYNILEMARSLSKQFDLWSIGKEGPELSKMKARIDSTRQGLKNMLKRELDKTEEWRELGVNPLEYYDSLWSPIIGTRSNIVKLRSAWNKAKSKITDKSALNRLGTWLDKIPFTKSSAARKAIDAMRGENIMSLITKEKELGKILKAIKDLEKKLPKDPTKEQIDSIMKDWTEKHPGAVEVIEGVVEGEVIEPKEGGWYEGRNPYLEEMFDKVDIEDPNLYLGEDTKYNGQSPIDYTDTTAVTPEGYPGRPGKTTESYKGQQKGEGRTPESWNKEKIDKYVSKWGQTVEGWRKQLEAAGVSPEAIDVLLEKLAKKNFKVSSIQPPLL